jgi:hypothetical protein
MTTTSETRIFLESKPVGEAESYRLFDRFGAGFFFGGSFSFGSGRGGAATASVIASSMSESSATTRRALAPKSLVP